MIDKPREPEKLLYWVPEYEFLNAYRHLLWDITTENILWEWWNGLILHNVDLVWVIKW